MILPFRIRTLFICAALVALFCAAPYSAFGQYHSNTPGVTANGTLPESITVSSSLSTLDITLTPFTTTASASITITTDWVLQATRTNVELDAYFASASQALANGSYYIPTSKIYGNVTTLESGGPSANAPFTQTAAYGPAGAGLVLFSEPITAGTNSENVDSTTLALKVDLSNSTLYKTLPAGTYTGTLTIEAKAI